MLKYVFQFLILLWFWYSNAKNKGTYFCSSSVLIGIYIVSAFCSLFCPDIMGLEVLEFQYDCGFIDLESVFFWFLYYIVHLYRDFLQDIHKRLVFN